MIFYGCQFCEHINADTFNECSAFPNGIPLSIIGGEKTHTEILDIQEGNDVFELGYNVREVPIEITTDLGEAILWEQEDFEVIGAVNGIPLIQVGLLPNDRLVIVAEPIAVDEAIESEERKNGINHDPLPDSINAKAVPLTSLSEIVLYE